MIDWVAIGQAHFESVVNMLVKKEWSVEVDAQVMPLDGRGGDQGIDIKVTLADGGLVVYQLKYFTDGISGGNRQRREQYRHEIPDRFSRSCRSAVNCSASLR